MQIERLLRYLTKEGVSECAVASGRFPAVRVSDGWRAVSEQTVTTDDIIGFLLGSGGSRHLDSIGTAPVQWTFTAEGVGPVVVQVTEKAGEIKARFIRGEPVASSAGLGAPKRPSRAPKRSMRPPGVELGGEERLAQPNLPRPPAAPQIAEAQPPVAQARPSRLPPDPKRLRPRHSPKIADGLDELMINARRAGASDLHVVADRPALVRIAGELLQHGESIPAATVERMLTARIPEQLRVVFEEDGSCDFAIEGEELGRVRANVVRQRTGLKGTFRLIKREVPTLAKLGLPADIAKATRHHQGLIVITGPTGHGKTSTLAAIIDIINTETTHHVITVEDPVEYVHPRKRAMMSQREVGTHTRTFNSALKASLREDPDVIVVGELRDTETVAMALAASETGHLVLGTMNTPSAAKTIDRLIDLFPPGDQQQVRMALAGGLKLVVGQRLVPSVDRKRMHAAAELLTGTVPLWNLIREEKTYQIPSLQQRGKALGIIRLDDSLAELVKSGKVRLEDAMAVAEAPEALKNMARV